MNGDPTERSKLHRGRKQWRSVYYKLLSSLLTKQLNSYLESIYAIPKRRFWQNSQDFYRISKEQFFLFFWLQSCLRSEAELPPQGDDLNLLLFFILSKGLSNQIMSQKKSIKVIRYIENRRFNDARVPNAPSFGPALRDSHILKTDCKSNQDGGDEV